MGSGIFFNNMDGVDSGAVGCVPPENQSSYPQSVDDFKAELQSHCRIRAEKSMCFEFKKAIEINDDLELIVRPAPGRQAMGWVIWVIIC
jgi:hypothetical protein